MVMVILFDYACNRFLMLDMSWAPSSYDEAYKLALICAIIVGAAWAYKTWRHQERLRKVKEEPGFECQMEFSQSKLSDGDILLAIDVVTTNTGVCLFGRQRNGHQFRLKRLISLPLKGSLRKKRS